MNIQRAIRRLRRSISLNGLPHTVKSLARIRLLSAHEALNERTRDLQHHFDRMHEVDTSGLIEGIDLDSGHDHDQYCTAYYAIAPSVFRCAYERWTQSISVNDRTVEDYTFIDIGAGKGRAVLLASELNFREVIGVELNPELVDIARKNIVVWRARGLGHERMRMIGQDATQVTWPRTPLLVYLFNPFGGPLLNRVLESLSNSAAECPRPIDILYLHPEFRDSFERRQNVRCLWSECLEMTEDDKAADVFSARDLLCNAYAIG